MNDAPLRYLRGYLDTQKKNKNEALVKIEFLRRSLEVYKKSIEETEEAIRVLENAQASTSTETA